MTSRYLRGYAFFTIMPTSAPYIGRFAPSPSGALHFGSLAAALGSYLQARAACGGQWRVRIEDIDPPREVPDAADNLLRQLNHYGLHWDGPVIYQSQRHEAYLRVLTTLRQRGLSYLLRLYAQPYPKFGRSLRRSLPR